MRNFFFSVFTSIVYGDYLIFLQIRGVNVDLQESARVAGTMLTRVYKNKAAVYAVLGVFALTVITILYIAVVR